MAKLEDSLARQINLNKGKNLPEVDIKLKYAGDNPVPSEVIHRHRFKGEDWKTSTIANTPGVRTELKSPSLLAGTAAIPGTTLLAAGADADTAGGDYSYTSYRYVDDEPRLDDAIGSYSWWRPQRHIEALGYNSSFWFTLASGNSSATDNTATWTLRASDGPQAIEAYIPSNYATAYAQCDLSINGRHARERHG